MGSSLLGGTAQAPGALVPGTPESEAWVEDGEADGGDDDHGAFKNHEGDLIVE